MKTIVVRDIQVGMVVDLGDNYPVRVDRIKVNKTTVRIEYTLGNTGQTSAHGFRINQVLTVVG
jgi:hypothetical protein